MTIWLALNLVFSLLAGPTSFAPIVEMATTIVEKTGGQYHVLLIIADGQVSPVLNYQVVQHPYFFSREFKPSTFRKVTVELCLCLG